MENPSTVFREVVVGGRTAPHTSQTYLPFASQRPSVHPLKAPLGGPGRLYFSVVHYAWV